MVGFRAQDAQVEAVRRTLLTLRSCGTARVHQLKHDWKRLRAEPKKDLGPESAKAA